VIVLTINRLYKQHFRKYTFAATSDLGAVTHDVMLKECKRINFSHRTFSCWLRLATYPFTSINIFAFKFTVVQNL